MPGEREAFLTAILANPDDDTPRLVFADWLDEQDNDDDHAHAALIRAQCRAEMLPLGSKERRKLEREANVILKQRGDSWAQALKDTRGVQDWTFRRGFLDAVEMSAATFAENAEQIFQAAPTIRSAYFPDASNEVGQLVSCKHFSRLATVDLCYMCVCGFCPIHNDLRALFRAKNTANLTELNIAGNRMDPEGAERLAKSSALKQLKSLDVSSNRLGNDGLVAIGKSKHLKQLASLDISATGFGVLGLEEFGKYNNLSSLQKLSLQDNRITTSFLKRFVATPLFAQLTSLDLSRNRFGDAGAKVLAAVPRTAKLESLIVWHCHIGEKGVARLKKRFGKGLTT